MKPISRFALGCCCLFCLSGVLHANDATEGSSQDNKEASPPDHTLGPIEVQYILEECEKFAVEDNISSDKHASYIETCTQELSIAVKRAIDKLQATSESLVAGKSINDVVEN